MNEFRVAVLGRSTMAVLSTEFAGVEGPSARWQPTGSGIGLRRHVGGRARTFNALTGRRSLDLQQSLDHEVASSTDLSAKGKPDRRQAVRSVPNSHAEVWTRSHQTSRPHLGRPPAPSR